MKVVIFFAALVADIVSPATDEKAVELMSRSIKSDLSIVSPSERTAVVARVREVGFGKLRQIGTASVDRIDAQIVLVRLGDTESIERLMQEYRRYDSMYAWDTIPRIFQVSRQPSVIAYLAEDLSSKDDPNRNIVSNPPPDSTEFGVTATNRSVYSGVIITRVIEDSPEFSPALKKWAKDMYEVRLANPGNFRDSMRTWWEENRDAFRKGDYKSVVPLPPQTPPVPSLSANAASPAPSPMAATPQPTIPAPAEILSQPAPNPTAAPNVVAAPNHIFAFVVLGAVTAGLVLLALWKSFKK